mmetsp:Transcript_18670/g.21228  ORF Transcript_18670/g.21228 Transcript_18670/m.21228 type:complete len:162 (+) Transcript_18670:1230-1715(+)
MMLQIINMLCDPCSHLQKKEVAKFNLEKCMRCLPHDLDTGGFFIALFKKVKPVAERARRKAQELEQNECANDAEFQELKRVKLNTLDKLVGEKNGNDIGNDVDVDSTTSNAAEDMKMEDIIGKSDETLQVKDQTINNGRKRQDRNYEKKCPKKILLLQMTK